jgi:hypothetical protein
MDLEGMIEKIPSTEKILGVVWITSWVLAIWMYHVQFFLTGLFCLFLVLILLGKLDKNEEKTHKNILPAVFSMDKNTKTLKVQKLYEEGLKWDEHEVCSGMALLPSGPIKEGDVVTGCKGNVALRHIPTNKLFGGFNFEE